LAHEAGIGVAGAAQFGHGRALNLAFEAGGLAHGAVVGFAGIAAVTTGTRQSLLRVNILRELLLGDVQFALQRGMAIYAAVGLLRLRQRNRGCEH